MRPVRIAIGIVCVVGAIALAAGAWLLLAPGPSIVGPVVLPVAEGERFAQVADDLVRLGVVRSAATVRAWARLTGADRQIGWGDYLFQPPLTPRAVVERLARPPDPIGLVTIPEGLTMDEVVTVLVDHGRGPRERLELLLQDPEFLRREGVPVASAEGYRFRIRICYPARSRRSRSSTR